MNLKLIHHSFLNKKIIIIVIFVLVYFVVCFFVVHFLNILSDEKIIAQDFLELSYFFLGFAPTLFIAIFEFFNNKKIKESKNEIMDMKRESYSEKIDKNINREAKLENENKINL